MISQSLLPILALAIPFGFGQIGFYGPVTKRPHAGDVAPDLTFTRVLGSPGGASWSQSNFAGQLTVLAFFPNTSQNLQQVTLWNATQDKLACEPVQFVWITGERESTLLPWLEQDPIKGWVLLDSEGKTGNAYGMEEPAQVLIGTDGKIIGFFRGVPEIERLVKATQDGRITTTRPSQANLKAFIDSKLVLMDAEASRMPRAEDHRPAFPPSYTAHVSPSQSDERGNFGSNDFLALQGYTLKETIEYLYGFNPIRVQLPSSVDDGKRYDFSLVLPDQESSEQMKDRIRKGLQDYFHVDVRRENRLVDVYVFTVAEQGKLPAVEPRTGGAMGGFSSSSVEFQTEGGMDEVLGRMKPQPIAAIRAVSEAGSADEFCHTLETMHDRPMVNETNLEGDFVFRVESNAGRVSSFSERLREQLGLAIAPAQRNVEFLVIEPH